MNRNTIVAIGCLVGGGLVGWSASRFAGPATQGEHGAESQAHGMEAGPAVQGKEGHEEHGGHEGHEETGGVEGHEAHGDEKDEHAGHAEGSEPGAIPDSMLAVAGIGLDSVRPAVLAQVLELPGRIRNDPARGFTAAARFPGVLRSFGLKAGTKVKAGDLLARIESDATLEPYEVRAPKGGTVMRTEASEGQAVAAGQVLAEIADLGSVLAELKIASREFAGVRVGQPVWIRAGAEDAGKKASLSLLLPQVDASTQMRTVQVRLDNPRGFYGEGLFVQGLLETGRAPAALTVPLTSLQTSKGRSVVYVREGERFEERAVTTGRKDAQRIEILSGLRRGERVASAGSFVVKADLGKGEAGHEH